jgi:hypothetical protein
VVSYDLIICINYGMTLQCSELIAELVLVFLLFFLLGNKLKADGGLCIYIYQEVHT